MAGEKFIQHDGKGSFNEVEATQTGGSGNEGKIPSLDANGRLDETMMPTGIGADTANITASEALAAGDFVNVYNNAGTANVRKADATTNGKPAHGFVKSSVANARTATVFFEGNNDAVTGATGGIIYLSATAGGFTSTAPTSANNLVQRIGVATSSTNINFERTNGIKLA